MSFEADLVRERIVEVVNMEEGCWIELREGSLEYAGWDV